MKKLKTNNAQNIKQLVTSQLSLHFLPNFIIVKTLSICTLSLSNLAYDFVKVVLLPNSILSLNKEMRNDNGYCLATLWICDQPHVK